MMRVGSPVVLAAILTVQCGARSELADEGPSIATPGDAGPQTTGCALTSATPLASSSSSDDNVSAPYVRGGYVYWVQVASSSVHDPWNKGAPERIAVVRRVSVTGGAVEVVASFNARSDRTTVQVGFDSQWMYAATDPELLGPGETQGKVVRARLDGSDLTTLVAGLYRPEGVAVAGGKVYFTIEGTEGKVEGPALCSVNVDGSEETTIAKTLVDIGNVAIWTPDFAYSAGASTIARYDTVDWQKSFVLGSGPLAPGTPIIEGLSLDGDTGLAVASTFSYGGSLHTPATLTRWSPSGGSLITIATGLDAVTTSWPQPAATASDGAYAYVDVDGRLARAPLAGGALETMGPSATAGGIAFDDSRVFWSSYDASTVTIYAACR